jgi:hypothetical protein
MLNVLPYVCLLTVLTILFFGAAIIVGLRGSAFDVFFLLAGLISGVLSVVMYRKYREDKRMRRF